jgi:hypothetical protein
MVYEIASLCFMSCHLKVEIKVKVKVKLSLCLTKYHTMKTYPALNKVSHNEDASST